MVDKASALFFDELIGAQPGWDVLYYRGDCDYVSEPIVAWAILDREGFVKAVPCTADCEFDLDHERTIMAPDGSIRCGDTERWDHIAQWLDTMRNRNIGDQHPASGPSEGTAPIVLDNFRRRFQKYEEDAS